jgi:hypothetical protein
LLSIAVDVQGSNIVKRYARQFGVTFPVAVDSADVFGRAYGLKAVPVTFLVDENGIVRLRGTGPTRGLLKEVEAALATRIEIDRKASAKRTSQQSKAELERAVELTPEDWRARIALAESYEAEGQIDKATAQCEAAAKAHPYAAGAYFAWGKILLHHGNNEAGLEKLKRARDLDPDNWRIRKQIWAIENPDKFYSDKSPDFAWQKEELKREKGDTK